MVYSDPEFLFSESELDIAWLQVKSDYVNITERVSYYFNFETNLYA